MADAHQKKHDYHIIDPSPWPLLASIGAFVLAFGGIGYMRYLSGGTFHLFDPNTGRDLDTVHLGGNVEASAAVYGNMIVIGSYGQKIFGIKIS